MKDERSAADAGAEQTPTETLPDQAPAEQAPTEQAQADRGHDETRNTMDETTTLQDAARTTGPRPARASTIVWGMILLAIAALYAAGLLVDFEIVDPLHAVAWGVTGLGVAVVLVGLIAAATRRR